jgi:hypothetical protein
MKNATSFSYGVEGVREHTSQLLPYLLLVWKIFLFFCSQFDHGCQPKQHYQFLEISEEVLLGDIEYTGIRALGFYFSSVI